MRQPILNSQFNSVLFLLIWETATLDIADILADSIADVLAKSAVGAKIAGLELLGDAQHVLEHKHLSVCAAAGPNADGGYLDVSSDLRCQFGWNLFQYEGKAACLFEYVGVVDEAVGLFFLGGTHYVGAEFIDERLH